MNTIPNDNAEEPSRNSPPPQKQILAFITVFIAENGYPPTLRELAAHLKISGNLGVS